MQSDLRSEAATMRLFSVCRNLHAVLHLAGQVAVTTSVAQPRLDFEANALGTLNLLEAVRRYCPGAALIYASTNKAYGAMPQARVMLQHGRYTYQDCPAGMRE